jgi:hypothetical protein
VDRETKKEIFSLPPPRQGDAGASGTGGRLRGRQNNFKVKLLYGN